MKTELDASYILPLRATSLDGLGDLAEYLHGLPHLELIVVDGSAQPIFDEHRKRFPKTGIHVPPDADIKGLNGKVRGVLTGLRRASHELVIVADDDVRYDLTGLQHVIALLEHCDVVRPQNYFAPMRWHALLDTSRTLINRVTGGDWPGTLGLRRSALPARGYSADVLFENLELIRTVLARGGKECRADDCYLARRSPTTRHYWSQRIRQAYDEFARPGRMLAALAILPFLALSLALRAPYAIVLLALAAMTLAELGWLKQRGWRYFSAFAILLAPLWALERGVCAWLAVFARLRWGGIPYAGAVIREAATPLACLRAQL